MDTVVVTVNDTVYRLTEDDVAEYIKRDIAHVTAKEELRKLYSNASTKVNDIHRKSTEFFQNAFDESTEDSETTITLDEANEFLTSIGAREISRTFTATITVEVTISGVEAANIDDVEDVVTGELDISCGMFNVDTWSIHNVDAERE
jgi:hypothetical protein